MSLAEQSLADLHARAAELDVPRYRMLKRDELIAELEQREGAAPAPSRERRKRREQPARSRSRRERPRRDEAAEDAPPPDEEPLDDEPPIDEAETEEVNGILDLMPQRFGFLRLQGLEAADGDVYISASQIRRCELRAGDLVSGPAREPRRGERHRALVRVETVNGSEPAGERLDFDELTAIAPTRRLELGDPGNAEEGILVRAVDLLAPLALGQRVLVSAPPRSGRTTLMRGLARALSGSDGTELVVLLIDERPEEATRWRQEFPGARLAIATAEMTPAEQGRMAQLALAHVRRLAESGTDAVLLVDSLSRLSAGRRDAADVKRLFGSGRQLSEEGAGSLTVVATVLDRGEDGAREAVETTENATVALDAELAGAGIFPAISVAGTRVSGEQELRSAEEHEAARRLRGELAELPPSEAAALLRERIEGSASNAELLSSR